MLRVRGRQWLVAAMVLVFLAGCSQGGHDKSVKQLGSHRVCIMPGSPNTSYNSRTSGGVTHYEFICAGTKVLIDNEELTVNGVSYGKLEENDSITIILPGTIYINDREVAKGGPPS